MDAGHGGASGRFEAIKELAKEFSFIRFREKIKLQKFFGNDCSDNKFFLDWLFFN
jgi:hypothetical protein